MTHLELKGSKHIYTQDNSLLSIYYFLVQELSNSEPIYGIQILTCRNQDPRQIHTETISHVSFSPDYTIKLIQLCMKHLVTPTDLFSSADILMDIITE